jgi:hypothetical protein
MPSGKRVGFPEWRPGTSRVTQRLGIRPRPNTAAHRRRAVASPRPPAYMARSRSALNGRIVIVASLRLAGISPVQFSLAGCVAR